MIKMVIAPGQGDFSQLSCDASRDGDRWLDEELAFKLGKPANS
jgi:hypothetical protein